MRKTRTSYTPEEKMQIIIDVMSRKTSIQNISKEKGIALCGLSALMTTTVDNMRVTVEALKRECPACKVMVGGAVLTEEYAASIGADRYCRDAAASARYAAEVFANA